MTRQHTIETKTTNLNRIRYGMSFKKSPTDMHYYVKGEYDAKLRRHECKAYTLSGEHKPYRWMDRYYKGTEKVYKIKFN